MAKPQHTAYQIQADFVDKESLVKVMTDSRVTTVSGPAAISSSCIASGKIRSSSNYRRSNSTRLAFTSPEFGHVHFGYGAAEATLAQARTIAKVQFTKGERPSFFLRKLTMSEFMAHEQFQNYKDNALVKSLYKKYLLMDLLK